MSAPAPVPAAPAPADPMPAATMSIGDSRRRLVLDSLAIAASGIGFGLVYGLTARAAGFSALEAGVMSIVVFAGASQFAVVGYVASGLSWAGIVLFTAFLNARHLLYSAALAPYLSRESRPMRAAMAHVLTDEAFALSVAHFRRVGRADVPGYWLAAIVGDFIPWVIGTIAGVTIGGSIPDPSRLGLDIIFPASMAGLAVGLISGRRELVAAVAGAAIGAAVALAWDPAIGIVAGGVLGPVLAMTMRPAAGEGDGENEPRLSLARDPEAGLP